ncbi:MAG: exopolysaccharide biosynthesis protein [Alteromonadaceae bacterium]|jgi:capsular exopolysaccharide synthesis family protein|uniref:polysaccharide biosynthesis tyrosine autokinase n=1 Tax=unclassified Methylophaga TaxID=2629249 RepID=UPI000C37A00E|nr:MULTISPECIES: polysaccharide biosynthesis tyrosine autokinase [unclassified Methylophaga]MAP27324.1 exopolysaccharide biosynthesis protein [Methylophaga sp.]MBN23474.1 exopolysaccharide biosynthesis protein [Alteromonadaceae bacterium]|tara:strand:+ start:2867 stop:3703 length:837 start_codon:yes stop_codon:yes gene_type:complete
MDRIQKALEKAKQRHAQKPEPIRVEPTKAEKSVSQAEDPLAAPIESISYSQTKVVNVPNQHLERKRIIAGFYNNPQSAVFRMLRTQVLKKMRSNRWQTLAVTSPTAGEGKSVVAANLAMAIAMELNQTVLLVDMDLRNPSISNYFGLNAQVGLKDYLSGDLKLSEVLINPGIKRLVILPGVGRAEDSAELLSSPKMASLVADIKSQYDSRVIIFDVPPVLQTDDVSLAASYFDSTLLVLEDGKNTESNITKSLQMLEGSHLLGTVVNKSASPPEHQNY